MNYPTGAGVGTGNHYNNVAAQMRAYVNNPRSRGYSSYQYGGGASASQLLNYSAQRLGVNPAVANDLGGFARSFARSILR